MEEVPKNNMLLGRRYLESLASFCFCLSLCWGKDGKLCFTFVHINFRQGIFSFDLFFFKAFFPGKVLLGFLTEKKYFPKSPFFCYKKKFLLAQKTCLFSENNLFFKKRSESFENKNTLSGQIFWSHFLQKTKSYFFCPMGKR